MGEKQKGNTKLICETDMGTEESQMLDITPLVCEPIV